MNPKTTPPSPAPAPAEPIVAGAPVFRPGSPVPATIAPFLARPVHAPPIPKTIRKKRALRRTLRSSSVEGVFAELINAFVGGAMLIAWALYLGCGPVLIALLGALPFLSQIVQIPAASLTAALGSRRVAIAGYAGGRLIYVLLVGLPFLPVAVSTQRLLLVAIAGTAAALTVVGTNAWVAWMGEVVPVPVRGRYFGKRLSAVTLGGATAALFAGLLLDVARRGGWEPVALASLAGAATLSGVVTLLLLRRHQDVPVDRRRATSEVERGAIRAVLRDPAARPYLRYQVVWNLGIGVSATFFAVHMIENLQMDFALIALHGVAVASMRVILSPLWGKLIDRVGARPVLVVCSFALVAVPLVWLLPTSDSLLVPLALDVLLAGGLWAGHMLAAFELPLATAPRERRPFYLAAYNLAGGLAFAAASIGGGFLAASLPSQIYVLGTYLDDLHLLFLLSAFGRLAAAPLALSVREPGAQPVEAIFRPWVERLVLGRPWLARALAFARR